MKQMMRIEFYPTVWDDKTHWLEKEETIIDPECIVRIDGIETKPVEVKDGYQSYRKVKDEKMALVYTTIAVGRGINGIDYKAFWVSAKTHKKLMGLFEII